MDLRQLQCLVTVADELSFSRAARRLLFTTSNVSQHIGHLERDLGLQLLDRRPGRVSLTPAGEMVYEHARRILREMTELREEAAQATAASAAVTVLAAGYCPGAGDMVGEMATAASSELPGIHVDFRRLQTADVVTAVTTGQIGVGISRSTGPGLSILLLTSHPQSALVVPEAHRLTSQTAVRLSDLDGEDYILIARSSNAYFHRVSRRVFLDRGIHPRFRVFPIRTCEEALELVAARNGCILTTDKEATDYAPRGTAVLPVMDEVPVTEHFLLWRQGDERAEVAAFVELARRLAPVLQTV